MQRNKNKKAFTLIEMLVIITIVATLALGISRLNFWEISQRELINTEVVRLVASIEEMRNNAIVWRAYNEDWDFPDSWNVRFIDDSSYSLGYTEGGNTEVIRTVDLRSPFTFEAECSNTTWSDTEGVDGWITFFITWELVLDWCGLDNWRILDITLWTESISRNITVNTITWVIEENQ